MFMIKGNLITRNTIFSILLCILQRYIVIKIGKKGNLSVTFSGSSRLILFVLFSVTHLAM